MSLLAAIERVKAWNSTLLRLQLAQKYAKELEKGTSPLPFNKIVWCNIGNPQILGQKPITYFRQILALCEYPQVRWQQRGGTLQAHGGVQKVA